MECKPYENGDYFINKHDKWLPFEVFRMRYEEAFSALPEEELTELRKYQGKWFYKVKKDKTYQPVENEEQYHLGLSKSVTTLDDKEKLLVIKKPIKKDTPILRNVQAHHLYFSLRYQKEMGEYAYLLYDEAGKLVQKERIQTNLQVANKEQFILQVVEELTQKIKQSGIQKVIFYTHHLHQNKILKKFNSNKQINQKAIKQQPKLYAVIEQVDYFEFQTIQKKRNKKAIQLLGPIPRIKRVQESDVLSTFYQAYVDISANPDKKEAYIAGVLKNEKGKIELQYVEKVPYSENTTKLEMDAVVKMMQQATNKRCLPVTIHTDNKSAFEYFEGIIPKRQKNQTYYQLVNHTKKKYPHCYVKKVDRKKNKEAHNLSRKREKLLV